MLKRMTLLARRLDLSFDEFSSHWVGTHGEIVKRMPMVHGYIQNPVARRLLSGLNPQDPYCFDGVVELWFADLDAQKVAFAADAAKELPVDEVNFIRGITIFPVEEEPLDAPAPVKVLVAARFNAVATVATMAEVASLVADLSRLSGARVVTVNHLGQSSWREHLWHEPNPPQVLIELGLDTAAAATTLASQPALTGAHAALTRAGGNLECYQVSPRRII